MNPGVGGGGGVVKFHPKAEISLSYICSLSAHSLFAEPESRFFFAKRLPLDELCNRHDRLFKHRSFARLARALKQGVSRDITVARALIVVDFAKNKVGGRKYKLMKAAASCECEPLSHFLSRY